MAESKGYSLGTGYINATISFDGIGKQIANEMKKARRPAEEGGKDTGERFQGGFRKGISNISERIREAVVSSSAMGAATAGGYAAGTAWTQGFNRGMNTKAIVRSMGSMFAALSGARVLKDVGSGFKDFITNIDRTTPKLGVLSAGLLTLGGAGIAAVGGILGAANAIGSIAAVGLVLPGLLGAAAASVAVFSMAMADLTTVFADLGPAFTALQDNVSASFWARAEQPIRNLADNVLPILQNRMVEVAHEMGGIAVAVANAMNSGQALAQLDAMFVYLRDAIDTAGDGVGAMTSAIMTLGTVGSSYLPDLASWFNRISYSFEGWVERSAGSGDIFRWIETGITNLKALGSVLVSTVGIFHALGTAAEAAGAGGLVGLAAGMERVLTALRSPEWQAGLTSMFSGASEAMARVGDGFGNMARGLLDAGGVLREGMILSGDAVGMVLTAVGGLFSHPAVQGGLYQFFHGIHLGVSALAAATAPLGSVLGGLLGVMGNLASMLGSVVGQAFYSVGPAFAAVLAAAQPLVPILGTALFNAFDFLRPAIVAVGSVLANVVAPALRTVFGFIADNMHLLLGLFTAFATGAAVVAAFGAASWVASGGLTALITAKIAAATATRAYTAAQWLLNTALTMNPIGLVIAALAALGVGLVLAWKHSETFREVVTGAWEGIKSATSATVSWFSDTAWPVLKQVIGYIAAYYKFLFSVAKVVWTGIFNAIGSVLDWFANTAVPAFKSALDSLGGFFNFLYRNFIAPFVWLFQVAISKTTAWFNNVALPIFRAVTGAIGAAFDRLLNATVRPVWNAIRSAINAVSNWFRNTLVPFFRATINALGNAFRVFKSRTIDPVWSGIRATINAVGNWFRTVLVPAFRAAVQGLQNKFAAFRTVVVAVWDRVRSSARAAWDYVDRQVFQKFRNGLSVLEAAFKATRKGISDAWNKLRDAVKKPIAFVVTKVINPFIGGYNKINNAWSGDDIDKIPGFRKGGYTGKRDKDEVAGLVHGDEHVIRSESRRSIENTSPGLLDAMNKYGASALHAHSGPQEAVGSGVYGGIPSFTGPLPSMIKQFKTLYLRPHGYVSPRWGLHDAAAAWSGVAGLNVKVAKTGMPAAHVRQTEYYPGTPSSGNWAGYFSQPNNIALRPRVMGMSNRDLRTITIHEVGHALGLPHAMATGARSIMNYDTMFGMGWPGPQDYAAVRAIYGGSGNGGKYAAAGAGGGGEDDSSLLGDLLKKVIKGPLGQLAGLSKGNLFGGMAKGLAEKIIDGLIEKAKDLFTGKGLGINDLPGFGAPFADQKWDDPVGTVHKLSPGVSSIYNGTGGDEFFQRVGPGSGGGFTIQGDVYTMSVDELMRVAKREQKKQEAMYA